MLGYTIQKTRNNNYQHLNVDIYFQDEYGYDRFAKISWQTDSRNEDWYGFEIDPTLHRRSNSLFEQYVKFCQRVLKAGMYNRDPEDVLEWLEKSRLVRLVYDERVRDVVSCKNAQETADHISYRVCDSGGSLITYTMGRDKKDAMAAFIKKTYRPMDYIEKGVTFTPEDKPAPIVENISDILEIKF